MSEVTPVNLKAFINTSEGEVAGYFDSRYFKLDSETRCIVIDIDAIRLEVQYPIGSQYIQRPAVASNDYDTAFPVNERPETLFGGVWSRRFDSEAITFYSGDEAGDQIRTNGLQLDQMQVITGVASGIIGSGLAGNGVFTRSGGSSNTVGSNVSFDLGTLTFSSATSPNSRTGTQSKGKNRIELTWVRIS